MNDDRSMLQSVRVDVRDVSIHPMGGPLPGPTGNARQRHHQRRGLLVCARDAMGRIGLGEASPLPGHSPDTLDQCHAALVSLARDADQTVGTVGLHDIERICQRVSPPAARFALELALLDLLARAADVPLAEFLGQHLARPVRASVPVCTLVDPRVGSAPERALDQVSAAFARGVRCFKIKLGREFASELALLRAIRARHGQDLRLRLDVNRAWTLAECRQYLPALAEFSPDFVEEPCPAFWQLERPPVPLAADESLGPLSDPAVHDLLARDAVAVAVLKPMVLGGVMRALRLAQYAASRGVRAVISHLLDGPVAFTAYAQCALLCDETPGLDRHPGLDAWPPMSLPDLESSTGRIRQRARPGLGLSARALLGPRDGLHISAQRRRADLDASRPAVILGDQALGYAELDERVAHLHITPDPAHIDDGFLPVIAERSMDTVLRLHHALEERIPAVLLHPRATERERAQALDLVRSRSRSRSMPPDPGPDSDPALAFILFTSGSQGRPKGVLLERRAFVASARASAQNLGWHTDDRWLCALPLAHIGGLSILTRALLAGRTAVLTPEGPFDPHAVAETVARARVTLMSLVPTMLVRLLDIDWSPPARLRAILLGGAPASRALLERAHERGLPVLTTYGMTETCAQVCTREYPPDDPYTEPGCVGPPLPGVELDIRDRRIFVRGPMLMRGYLGAPSPIDERGFLDTGDRGHRDERGRLWVAGRADDTIITGGENVDPARVEDVLADHPAIRSVCVFGVPDPTWGQRIAAVVVAERPLAATEVRAFVRERLPAHERPRLWCQVASMPTTQSHKVARQHVAATLRAALQEL